MAYTTFSQNKTISYSNPCSSVSRLTWRVTTSKSMKFLKTDRKQLSFFWRPEEVDVSRDRIDYQALPEHEKHILSAT